MNILLNEARHLIWEDKAIEWIEYLYEIGEIDEYDAEYIAESLETSYDCVDFVGLLEQEWYGGTILQEFWGGIVPGKFGRAWGRQSKGEKIPKKRTSEEHRDDMIARAGMAAQRKKEKKAARGEEMEKEGYKSRIAYMKDSMATDPSQVQYRPPKPPEQVKTPPPADNKSTSPGIATKTMDKLKGVGSAVSKGASNVKNTVSQGVSSAKTKAENVKNTVSKGASNAKNTASQGVSMGYGAGTSKPSEPKPTPEPAPTKKQNWVMRNKGKLGIGAGVAAGTAGTVYGAKKIMDYRKRREACLVKGYAPGTPQYKQCMKSN